MNVGKVQFQVQDEDPSFLGPGQSVALSNTAQLRDLPWGKSRTEQCHFLIPVPVQCERCGTDSVLEQCRWTCDMLEGLSVHIGGVGREVGKGATSWDRMAELYGKF